MNNNVYIPSIEAEEIFNLSERGLEIDVNYVGMFPYSCELIKLRTMKKEFGYCERKVTSKVEKDEEGNFKVKYESDSIINIKFKNKLSGGKEIRSFVYGHDKLIESLNKQLNKAMESKRYYEESKGKCENKRKIKGYDKLIQNFETEINRLSGHIERIESEKDKDVYKALNASQLREYLYVNGFTFNGNKYVFYKRTASKSRNANALFILESLHKPMIEWSRIGVEFKEGEKYDVASILAYESLISSSIEEVIKINPKNILIIDDRFSSFESEAIEVGSDLKPVPNEKALVENNIWDGQALIDISLMESIGKGDKGMALLRQHWFKACGFNTKIQKFLKDKHKEMTNPEHENYDKKVNVEFSKWHTKDMFGNKVYLKDVLMITTPSALKFLKMADKGKEKEAYSNWCKKVKEDKCVFGICKFEKPSKYNDRQKTSYQMINTLDAGMKDIEKLSQFEVEFIKGLQNDDEKYIQYLVEKKDKMNSHEMFVEMYKKNPNVVNTKLFRDYRKSQISKYRKRVKGGKLRLEADYTVVVANPYEMLLASIGKFETVESRLLHNNEVYTTLHPFNYTYAAVRNPHNAMNNFYQVRNVHNQLFEDYFNFTKNIIVVNNIKSTICARLNGMDMDSDTLLLFRNNEMNNIISNTLSEREYPLILNTIDSKPAPKELTLKNISRTDEKLAQSQRWIGKVTNLAQFLVSVLWDIQADKEYLGNKEKGIKEIMDNISVLVVLSNVAIDYAKKIVNCDIDQALKDINNIESVKLPIKEKDGSIKRIRRNKPEFWSYVTSGNPKSKEYNCPMDLLIRNINGIEKAKYRNNISLMSFVRNLTTEENSENYDNKQIQDILEVVNAFGDKMKQIHAKEHLNKEEKYNVMANSYEKINHRIGKKEIKTSTLFKILEKVDGLLENQKKEKDMRGVVVYLMNALYQNDKDRFVEMIKTI